MSKQILNSRKAPAAVGPYSQGTAVHDMIFVSGQLPIVPETGELLEGTIGEQTKQSLRNISAILKEAECTLENIVKVTIFICDMEKFAEVNAAYAEVLGEAVPARSCVAVRSLPKNAEIEIECIAVR